MNLLTPEQQQYLQKAAEFYQQMLQGMSPEEMEQTFQRSYVEPATKAYQENIVPQLQQRFLGGDESGSSALNQALASSAQDLASSLGSQYAGFQQQQTQNRFGAAQGLMGAGQTNVQQPYITPRLSTIDQVLQTIGQAGSSILPWGFGRNWWS